MQSKVFYHPYYDIFGYEMHAMSELDPLLHSRKFSNVNTYSFTVYYS